MSLFIHNSTKTILDGAYVLDHTVFLYTPINKEPKKSEMADFYTGTMKVFHASCVSFCAMENLHVVTNPRTPA